STRWRRRACATRSSSWSAVLRSRRSTPTWSEPTATPPTHPPRSWGPRNGSAAAGRPSRRAEARDGDGAVLGDPRAADRWREPVLHHRRADQPHGPEDLPGATAPRRPEPDRGRRGPADRRR